jgi:hypothetical protein
MSFSTVSHEIFWFRFHCKLWQASDFTVRRREREGERERESERESYVGSKKGREDLSVDYPSTQQSMFQTREKSEIEVRENLSWSSLCSCMLVHVCVQSV